MNAIVLQLLLAVVGAIIFVAVWYWLGPGVKANDPLRPMVKGK